MTQFTKSFIWRVIVHILLFGIIATIISRLLTALVVNVINFEGMTVCYPIILIGSVFNALTIMLAASMSIKQIFKKRCNSYLENPVKFFWMFVAIMIGINIFFSILSIDSTYNTCVKNMSTLKLISDASHANPSLSADEISRIVKDEIMGIVKIAVVIQNILQTVIISVLTPVLIKKFRSNSY